jgi:hypothetical protein
MLLDDVALNYLTGIVLAAAIEVHRVLGPGLLESIVEDKVVVEVKSVEALAPVYKAQVLTYLRVTGMPAGLLVNFNVPRLMDGVKRLINPACR